MPTWSEMSLNLGRPTWRQRSFVAPCWYVCTSVVMAPPSTERRYPIMTFLSRSSSSAKCDETNALGRVVGTEAPRVKLQTSYGFGGFVLPFHDSSSGPARVN